jgi:hypothetical protein
MLGCVMSAAERRFAGWCGIVFSVLSLIVAPMVAFSFPPGLGGDVPSVAAWYGAHKLSFLVGNYLGIVAFVPGFVQLVALAARVKKLEGPDGWLGALVVATGTYGYAVFACSLVVFQAMPFLASPHLQGPIESMHTLASVWFALDGLAAVPLVLAVGWATRRTGALPKAFATASWIVAALAILMSLGSLTTKPAWLAAGNNATGLGFIAFFAWTLAIGVAFLRAPA